MSYVILYAWRVVPFSLRAYDSRALRPALQAHFSDGMGTEGDVDDGNPILQTLPETEEDTIQQDVNEPGCELGIEQPAVSPSLCRLHVLFSMYCVFAFRPCT